MVMKIKEEQLMHLMNSATDVVRYRGQEVIDATKMSPMTIAMIYNRIMTENDTITVIR